MDASRYTYSSLQRQSSLRPMVFLMHVQKHQTREPPRKLCSWKSPRWYCQHSTHSSIPATFSPRKCVIRLTSAASVIVWCPPNQLSSSTFTMYPPKQLLLSVFFHTTRFPLLPTPPPYPFSWFPTLASSVRQSREDYLHSQQGGVEQARIIQALSQQRLAVVLEQIEDLLMRIWFASPTSHN